MKKNKRKKQIKAQAIFLALVIIASVMTISLVFGEITVRKLHSMTEVGESVKAYYAAESGIECQLYKDFVDQNTVCNSSEMKNQTSYQINKTEQGDTTIITSTGTSKKTKRSIQVQY